MKIYPPCIVNFLYMPLMHSEDLEIQDLSLKYFGALKEESAGGIFEERYNMVYDFARKA